MLVRRFLSYLTVCILLILTSASLNAAEPNTPTEKPKAIDKALIKEAEQLKKELVELNQELYQFEEELLYPANTQLGVFLSMAQENTFLLDSIEIRLDDKLITSYLYNDKEISALKKGGIQRLYLGSLSDGRHKLTARFNGQGANNRYFRRKKALPFTKGPDAKFIQLVVSESQTTREPLFKVKQW